ncbi:hypothetical protein [Pseudomonas sp. EMN2]|uniref:hypothetical protein n=1 Tax=Pseudomonas sp. EMN2 TaxID=2615212 RepID=UPI00129A9917|nr:hypothetical protein [Pseudomonas sp. EMN2]
MISSHTQQSLPAAELSQRGSLTHSGGDDYKFEVPANPVAGTGPVTSWWTAEADDHDFLQSLITPPINVWVELTYAGKRWAFDADQLAEWDEEDQEFQFCMYHKLAEPSCESIIQLIQLL